MMCIASNAYCYAIAQIKKSKSMPWIVCALDLLWGGWGGGARPPAGANKKTAHRLTNLVSYLCHKSS